LIPCSPLTIVSQAPSQADVAVYKAVASSPDAEKYPNAARWYKNIESHQSEFDTLPGDRDAEASSYGPEAAKAGDEDEEDVDLFGSDDEEEDEEKAAQTKKRLEEYAAKKAGKAKPGMQNQV
jgi:elongation factor 1-beta